MAEAPRRRPLVRATNLVVLAALPFALAPLLATFGASWWAFDLLAHFPMYGALVAALAAGILGAARRWRWALAFAVAVPLPLARIWPCWFGAPPAAAAPPRSGATHQLRVVAANLLAGNRCVADIAPWIAATSPDFVALAEVTPEAWEELKPLRSRFAHEIGRPQVGTFGIALLSNLPLRDGRATGLGFPWAPAIAAIVTTDAGDVGVLCVHLPRPGGPGRCAERDRALADLPQLLASLPRPCVAMGDFNATPWSAPFAAMLERTGLVDSLTGQGWQGSWPTSLPSLLRIPIDHVLVSPGLGIAARALGPHYGSDHLPVFAELAVPVIERR